MWDPVCGHCGRLAELVAVASADDMVVVDSIG
jgi:hypothetical protein